jgi:hypothetical protein
MHEQPFANVVMSPQVHAAHPTGFIEMGTRPFQPLTALAQGSLPACTANAPAVAVDGTPRVGMVFPVATPAIGFGDITPHADRFEIGHHLITVITLVGDHFFDLAIHLLAASISVSMPQRQPTKVVDRVGTPHVFLSAGGEHAESHAATAEIERDHQCFQRQPTETVTVRPARSTSR